MATRKKATKPVEPAVVVDDELDDELDDATDEAEDTATDEVDDTEDEGPVERDTYTAKQVATRIGTDAKTLRKFFRSPNSTVEPVGQGGRYEFDAADLPKIREEFTKWNSTKATRTPKAPGEKKPRQSKGRSAPANVELIEEDDEILELDDDELDDEELDLEPTDEELEELDDEVDDLDDELDD